MQVLNSHFNAFLAGLREKDMEHGAKSIIRNVIEVDESGAEELGGETLHGVEILLHGGACISQDVETSTKKKLAASLLGNRYHAYCLANITSTAILRLDSSHVLQQILYRSFSTVSLF